MSNVTTVRYLRRVNLGDYQHEEMEASVAVEGDLMEGMDDVRNKVNAILGVNKPDNNVAFSKEALKEEKPKEEKPKKEAPKKEKKAKEEKPKKEKKAPKTVPYNREEKSHRDEFASILSDRCSGWKDSDDSKAKAKELSVSLNGEPMFDAKGEILGSFADKIVEEMGLDNDL